MTGITEILSADVCFTLHCPGSLLSLVDTTFHTFPSFSYKNVNTETEWNKASAKHVTEFPFSREALQSIISSVLRRVYAKDRHASKRISDEVNVEPRTARAYLDGDRIPGGYAFFHLMVRCRELRDEINHQADELEAIYKVADQGNSKANNTVRGDNADFWLRGRAKAHVGCCQVWRHESVAFWPSLVLVDGWSDIGRTGKQPEDTEARRRCLEGGGVNGGMPV